MPFSVRKHDRTVLRRGTPSPDGHRGRWATVEARQHVLDPIDGAEFAFERRSRPSTKAGFQHWNGWQWIPHDRKSVDFRRLLRNIIQLIGNTLITKSQNVRANRFACHSGITDEHKIATILRLAGKCHECIEVEEWLVDSRVTKALFDD